MPTFSIRRTVPEDIPVIQQLLIGDDEFILKKRFMGYGTPVAANDNNNNNIDSNDPEPSRHINLVELIEKGYLCVTASVTSDTFLQEQEAVGHIDTSEQSVTLGPDDIDEKLLNNDYENRTVNREINETPQEDETIVAFCCFSDMPSTDAQLRKHRNNWEALVDSVIPSDSAAKGNIMSCNTLWLNFFASRYGNGYADEKYAKEPLFIPRRLTGPVTHSLTPRRRTTNNNSDLIFNLEQAVLSQMVATVFATCVDIKRVAYVLPLGTPAFSPMAEIFTPLEEISHEEKMRKASDNKLSGYGSATCAVYTLLREDHFIPIILRTGIPEDYDDFVPLLLEGNGVLTPLPKILYLEELLQDEDDPYKSVIVAEDPVTHNVIGLMCLDGSYAKQQHVINNYSLDRYGRLKPTAVPSPIQGEHYPVISCREDVVGDVDIMQDGEPVRQSHAHRGPKYHPKKHGKDISFTEGEHPSHNSFNITFFYLNPAYDKYSAQIMSYAFNIFKFAEYAYIYLPHATPEHQLLLSCHFMYCHLKSFQPSAVQGNVHSDGQGLWLCSRYGLENVTARPLVTDDVDDIMELLGYQSELPGSTVDAISATISQIGSNNNKSPSPVKAATDGVNCVTLSWRNQPIGVLITRQIAVDEMYAIRRNFDIDTFVNMNTSGGVMDYMSTDIHLTTHAAKASFYREDMPAHTVKYMYIKPIFCHRIRFLLREALRFTNAEVLLYIVRPTGDMYTPLLNELIFTQPRSVIDDVDFIKDEDGDDVNMAGSVSKLKVQRPVGDQQLDDNICLYHTSRKALSDEKTKIYARIVVIGSSTTGLSFIYSLLTIPYLHFGNILLISPDGLPEHPSHVSTPVVLRTRDWHNVQYLLLQLPGRFRILEGKMTDFDKFDRYVFTDDGTCEPYDHLILSVGRQYTIPKDMKAIYGEGGKVRNGVFCLSSGIRNVVKMLQYLKELEVNEESNSNSTTVVIYGCSLDVFCLVTTLINLHLASHRVVVVSPEEGDSSATSPFLDHTIDDKVDRLLGSIGVKTLRGYELHDLQYDEGNTVSSVLLAPITSNSATSSITSHDNSTSDKQLINIPASMLIYAHDKDIDSNVLCALNKRSIVFDGRVIVGNNYRTTDKNIYAAGPVATVSLQFGPTRDFEDYSAAEVGEHLAHTILGFLKLDEYYSETLHGENDDSVGAHASDNADELKGTSHIPSILNSVSDNNTCEEMDLSNNNPKKDRRRRPKPIPKYTDVVYKVVELPNKSTYMIAYSVDFPLKLAQDAKMGFHGNNTTDNNTDGVVPLLTHYILQGKDEDYDYARVSIETDTKYISSISYFGCSRVVKLHTLRCLVGLPETTLNFVYSFTQNSLYNATNPAQPRMSIDFLCNPILYITQYDRFRRLFSHIKDILLKNDGNRITKRCDGNSPSSTNTNTPLRDIDVSGAEYVTEVGRVKDDIRDYLKANNCCTISDKDRLGYVKRLTQKNSDTRRSIELEVIKFLHENKHYLPQIYYLPDVSTHCM